MRPSLQIKRPSATPGLRRKVFIDVFKYLIVMAAFSLLMLNGTQQLGYNWQWYRVPQYIITTTDSQPAPGLLIQGLLITIRITAISLLLAFIFGLTTALMRLSRSFLARSIARGYLEVIRNTPLLVQLFFIYFVLGPVLDISGFVSAVLALSLFEGAYASEIFRAGIVSIQRGQWEAAHSVGLNTYHTYRLVVLPQALRRILPPLTSQAISLIKDSALVSTIAIYDLTMRGQSIIAETFLVFEIWFTVAAIYLSITLLLSATIFFMEKYLKVES
ncbi:MAG: amino acid ABC transporter permease [Deltaproteobacteria bacterium]|nr:amino acid ABC transporter permease [Deltaproteobacteria bacterium]